MTNQNFKDFFESLDEQTQQSLADKADTSVAYLKQICSTHRKAGANLIDRLLTVDPRITYEMMRAEIPKRIHEDIQ